MEIAVNLILQLMFTVGVIAIFGFLIGYLNELFCKIAGRAGRPVLIFTGFLGTPVHELGHAGMCVLFGHKIVKMCLYQPQCENGTLGYVRHSYNKKNLYHQVGNFFIGIAPVISGSLAILLLLFLLLPQTFTDLSNALADFSQIRFRLFSADTYITFFETTIKAAGSLFSLTNISSVIWWIFMLASASIALHMRISASDIKTGATGFFFLVLVFLAVDIVLFIINYDYVCKLTELCMSVGAFLVGFLIFSIVLSLILILVSLIFKLLHRLIYKR